MREESGRCGGGVPLYNKPAASEKRESSDHEDEQIEDTGDPGLEKRRRFGNGFRHGEALLTRSFLRDGRLHPYFPPIAHIQLLSCLSNTSTSEYRALGALGKADAVRNVRLRLLQALEIVLESLAPCSTRSCNLIAMAGGVVPERFAVVAALAAVGFAAASAAQPPETAPGADPRHDLRAQDLEQGVPE